MNQIRTNPLFLWLALLLFILLFFLLLSLFFLVFNFRFFSCITLLIHFLFIYLFCVSLSFLFFFTLLFILLYLLLILFFLFFDCFLFLLFFFFTLHPLSWGLPRTDVRWPPWNNNLLRKRGYRRHYFAFFLILQLFLFSRGYWLGRNKSAEERSFQSIAMSDAKFLEHHNPGCWFFLLLTCKCAIFELKALISLT